ncbi:MAG: DNA mismatch repair endonuclease MutL, partial [Candidatus Thorarchaeota archaeon]
MGRIRILADDLVSLISAGEVIENPASIVKELIENALDANATNIDIRISEGGMESIIISDNGSGILKEDCPICTLRHSTSKIGRREDIDVILTYGFRGEALASIAAVADLAITTRHVDEKIGTRLVSRAGEIPAQTDVSRPQGTTVEVTSLFERVPARRKHLSTPRVESQRILETTMKHAIIRNDVGFQLTNDNKVIIDCPPGQNAETRVLSLWGSDIAESLVDVTLTDQGVTVSGFIARPPMSRGNRAREYFSVRKRPIEESKLSNAVETAYSTLLMKGRFPICALDIDVDIARVDANVHPTKREVRIQDIDSVTEVVKDAVKTVLADVKPPDVTQSLEEFVEVASAVGEGLESSRTMLPVGEQTKTVHRPGLLEQLALE